MLTEAMMRTKLIEAYIDYVNNYLTPELWGEHNGLNTEQSVAFLQLAKAVYDTQHPER